MIHLIEKGEVTQSWQSLPEVVLLPNGTRLHAQFLQRSYGWEYLESLGLFRELTQTIELGENAYISGYTGPEVIDGKPYRVPVVATKTTEQLAQELEVWREHAALPRHVAIIILRKVGAQGGIQEAINGIQDEVERADAQDAYDHAPTFRRNDPFVKALGPMAGLSDEQLDNLFKMGGA